MSASLLPNRYSASVLASSVLPVPVGPRKMNEPPGRRGSLSGERLRRMALATARTASSWPMMRVFKASSQASRRRDSLSVSEETGTPEVAETMSAICATSMVIGLASSSAFQAVRASDRAISASCCWLLSSAARFMSSAPVASSTAALSSATRASAERTGSGARFAAMRARAPSRSPRRRSICASASFMLVPPMVVHTPS